MSKQYDQNRKTNNPFISNSNQNNHANQNLWNNQNQNDNQYIAQSALNIKVDPNKFVLFGEEGVNQTIVTGIYNKNKLQKNKNTSNNNNKMAKPKMKYNNNPCNIKGCNNNNNNNNNLNKNQNNIKVSSTTYVPSNVNKISNGNGVISIENANQSHASKNKITSQLYDSKKANAPNPFFMPKNDNNNNINNNINPNFQNNNYLIINNNFNKNIPNKNIIFNNNNQIQNENLFNPKRTINKKNHNKKNNINININNNIKSNNSNNNQFQQISNLNMANNNNNNNNNNINLNMNQQNQPKEKQNQGVYSFNRYKKVALTGLENLGNTSYLNSVLQMICYIRNIASYFLNPKNEDYFQKNLKICPLAFVIHRLCTHLYPYPEKDNRKIYKPDSVMKILGFYNIVYNDYSEKNPKDFIIFLFNQLHEELNLKKNKNNVEFNFDNIKRDRNAIITYGINDFIKNNESIISNYFNFFEISEIRCLKCGNECYSFKSFPTFELNISYTAKWKKNQYVKISDCLEFHQMDKLKKNNFCNICKGYNDITTMSHIYTSPNYFIFLLDIKENQNVNLILEQKINLGKFIEIKDNVKTIFELKGIVFFDRNKNKYNSLCIHPVDNNWYLTDDENVQLFNINSFMNLYNTQNHIYVPCILLYYGIIKK